jgi:hypothetical protein
VTGFIVGSIEEAVSVLPDLALLDRTQIRMQFERRFSVERMADEYLAIYKSLKDRPAASRAA